jgi:hypothetical protein
MNGETKISRLEKIEMMIGNCVWISSRWWGEEEVGGFVGEGDVEFPNPIRDWHGPQLTATTTESGDAAAIHVVWNSTRQDRELYL